MARSLLDTLPAELGFLAPAVRQMVAVHEANRPAVDPLNEPERAHNAELAACFNKDSKILTDALLENFNFGDRQPFVTRVEGLRRRLSQWLEPQKRRPLTAETRLLFQIIGMLANPESLLPPPRRRRTVR